MADAVDVTFSSPRRRKVYLEDEMAAVSVPFTEVRVGGSKSAVSDGLVHLYDTSGPGSDPELGLPGLRRGWILSRGDVQYYDGRPLERRDDGRAAARRTDS